MWDEYESETDPTNAMIRDWYRAVDARGRLWND